MSDDGNGNDNHKSTEVGDEDEERRQSDGDLDVSTEGPTSKKAKTDANAAKPPVQKR